MSESNANQTILEKNNCYPEPVIFDEHYSIMMVAFDHHVNRGSLGKKKQRLDYAKLLHDKHWHVHDYLIAGDEKSIRKSCRRFQPARIMTPQTHEVFYGESLFSGDLTHAEDTSAFIKDRLNPDVGSIGLSESLMFSLVSSEWLNTPLQASCADKTFDFEVNWVDLFLYNDGTGLLSIKLKSLANDAGISNLSLMNRVLRDFRSNDIMVAKTGCQHEPQSFWSDVVLHDWLGFGDEVIDDSLSSQLFGNDKKRAGLLLSDQSSPMHVFDRFQKHCKVMVAAQMPDLGQGESAMLWGRPVSDPPIYLSQTQLQAIQSGSWDATLTAAQKAISDGYATVRDLVLFELAVVSDEQTSTGWKGGRGWQYGVEYMRKVVDNNFVEIWEYWAGIALRDTCVFVSYDKKMPIIWQAESFYYPLYALAYHNHYKLNCLSRAIIDYDMADTLNGRKVRDDFQRFRNQYWFQDVTTDFQGVEVYNQIKHGMDMDAQYETVAAEVADVSDHLQEKWDRGTRVFFTMLAVMLAPLMEVWNTWLLPKLKEAPLNELIQMAGGVLVLLLLILIVWLRFRSSILAMFRKLLRKFHRLVGHLGNQ